MQDNDWYKLDNVGKFFAATATNTIPNVFRFSVVLTEKIDKLILQQALYNTIEIFPNFNVNLKKGFFWYYLEETKLIPNVHLETLPICYKLYNDSDDYLYRVSYYNNIINLEVSHILSDGRGSCEFFKTLISYYLKIKYKIKISISTISSKIEKSEDSFDKYYNKGLTSKSLNKKIYLYKGKKNYKNNVRFMDMHLDVSKVLELSHKYNCTLTEFLVSVLIYSIRDEISVKDIDKYIKIDIPVDLRAYFQSLSCRNFFGLAFIYYKFKSKNDSLEEIVEEVKKQFKENINQEKLAERVNKMMSFEKNVFCRFVPIGIKNIVIKMADKYSQQKGTTSTLSNIGIIKLNSKLDKYIKYINVLNSTSSFQFVICSYKNDLSIGISTVYKHNNIIKNFCRYFSNYTDVVINVSEVK